MAKGWTGYAAAFGALALALPSAAIAQPPPVATQPQPTLEAVIERGDFAAAFRIAVAGAKEGGLPSERRARHEAVAAISAMHIQENDAATLVDAALRAVETSGANRDLLPHLYLAKGLAVVRTVSMEDSNKTDSIARGVALAEQALGRSAELFAAGGLSDSPSGVYAKSTAIWVRAWISAAEHDKALAKLKRFDAELSSRLGSGVPARAYVTDRFADLLFKKDRLGALKRIDESIALVRSTRPKDTIIPSLLGLGAGATSAIDEEKALQYSRQAIAFWRSAGAARATLNAYLDLALLLIDLGRSGLSADAEAWVQLARETYEANSEPYLEELDRINFFLDQSSLADRTGNARILRERVLREMVTLVEKLPDRRDKLGDYGKQLAELLDRSTDGSDEETPLAAPEGTHLSERLAKLEKASGARRLENASGAPPADSIPPWKTRAEQLTGERRYVEAAIELESAFNRLGPGDAASRLDIAKELVELHLWHLYHHPNGYLKARTYAEAGIAAARQLGGARLGDEISLGLARAAALLYMGQAAEADRALTASATTWGKALSTPGEDTELPAFYPSHVLFLVTNSMPSLKAMTPALTRDFLAVANGLGDMRSTEQGVQPQSVADAILGASAQPAGNGRQLALLRSAAAWGAKGFSKSLEGILKILERREQADLLSGLTAKLDRGVVPAEIRLLVEIETLKVLTAPPQIRTVSLYDWPDYAEALVIAGDLAGARSVLTDAPDSAKADVALTITEQTRDRADFEAALRLSRTLEEEDKGAALSRLARVARKAQFDDWRVLLVESGEVWRHSNEFFETGEMGAGISALNTAPPGKIEDAIHAAAANWDGYTKSMRESLLPHLRTAARNVADPIDRASVLRHLAEQAHKSNPGLAIELAAEAQAAIRSTSPHSCTTECGNAQFTSRMLAQLFAEWGRVKEALSTIGLLPGDRRVEEYLQLITYAPKTSANTILVQAAADAAKLRDVEAARSAYEKLADAASKQGNLKSALLYLRMSQAQGPPLFGDGRQEALLKTATYQARVGEIKAAEQTLLSLTDPADRATATVYLTSAIMKPGATTENRRVIENLARALAEAGDDRRDYPTSLAADEIIRPLAKAGDLSAIEFTLMLGGDLHDVALLLSDLFKALPREQVVSAALKAADALMPGNKRVANKVYLGRQLAEGGAPAEALAILRTVRPENPESTAAMAPPKAAELRRLIVSIRQRLLSVSSPSSDQADEIAIALSVLEDQVAAVDESLRRELLEVAAMSAARSEFDYMRNKLRLRLAELEGKAIDPARELQDELAAVQFDPKNPRYLDYYRIAQRATERPETMATALIAARKATDVQWKYRMWRLRAASGTSTINEDRESADQVYFLHLALIAREMESSPGSQKLLEEAFSVAQRMTFSPVEAEVLLGSQSQLRQLRQVRADLDRAKRLGRSDEVAALAQQAANLADAIRKSHAKAEQVIASGLPGLSTVQRGLAADQAVLLYALQHGSGEARIAGREPDGFVFVITQESSRLISLGSSSSSVDARVLKFARALRHGGWTTRAARAAELEGEPGADPPALAFDSTEAFGLYRMLLAPALEGLKGVKELLVVAEPSVSRLPLHLLVTRLPEDDAAAADLQNLHWIARQFTLTEVPGLALLEPKRQSTASSPSKPFLGFGDPDLSQAASREVRTSILEGLGRPDAEELAGLRALPDTAVELRLSAKALGAHMSDSECTTCVGSQATEELIRKLSISGALADYRVISFATHGLLRGEVSGLGEAALVLTPGAGNSPENDGLLTASEVAALTFNADLVILSACNTAVVDENRTGNSLSELASAFLHAGARGVLISHWPVDSEATAHLAATLADKLSAGSDYAAALRAAMLEMMKGGEQPRWSHPYFWAPFTLVQTAASTDRDR